MRILIAEDDAVLADGLSRSLRAGGYAVDVVASGDDADTALTAQSFDLLILDVGLPCLSGLEVLKRLRTRNSTVPVLILTAADSVEQRVKGLDLGADDYMAKPFALSELEARVRALTRRAAGGAQTVLKHGPLTLDQVGHAAFINDRMLDLSARELSLLEILLQRPGRLVSKEQLVDHLCSWGEEVTTNAIEVYVHRLRKKIETDAVRIVTVRGLGYYLERFADPAAAPNTMPDEGTPKRRLRVPWPPGPRSSDATVAVGPLAEKDNLLRNPLRAQFEQRSLFGEILDWMLAPLLLLWPMSVTVTYVVAQTIANAPFDRSLADAVGVLANHVRESRGEVTLQLPISTREVLRADTSDAIYYMVLGLRGEFVAGDSDLPLPPEDARPVTRDVQFRSDHVRGAEIRLAYTWVEFNRQGGREYALVQVAETLEKRSQLANEIIRGVIVPQFIVLPIAVLLVWFGLSRGLAPLSDLQARIRSRRPDDLSPIDPRGAPEEIAPLVSSFNEMLERLSQNLEMQQRFLADAAHQMKTPLAGLRTQAELALRETDPHELKRTLRHIAGSTERATHLINQLLALARAEYQASDPSGFQVIDLVPLARDLVRDSVTEAIARGVDLGFEGDDAAVRAIAAPMLVRELLKNLLDNALRYTPRGGAVTVRVMRRGQSAFLEVEDTGPGIPEGERQRVFDRFYRILGTNVDGSGLGLAIVREIAEQHGALVRIGNNPSATDPLQPGTLISVEFEALDAAQPTVDLSLPQ